MTYCEYCLTYIKNNMYKIGAIILFLFIGQLSTAQLLNSRHSFTRADTLRGSLRQERTAFDVLKYNLWVDVDIENQNIKGHNKINFKTLERMPRMQLDLFENMAIDSIVYRNKKLKYNREYNAVFIDFKSPVRKNSTDSLVVYYSGKPKAANNPPWDGGFIFTTDKDGYPWVSLAVQGIGASLWYPNKDTQSDKPEEAEIHVATPAGLMNVSNGQFMGKEELDNGKTLWSWKVNYPINNYNLVLNIGKFAHFEDQFENLAMDYYVKPYHLEAAKTQFEQAKSMMSCFYEKFGEYPFVNDGYKVVETPFLGMENQSAISYGNDFRNGYLGDDLSKTGVGLKWDFILIHESAHEWYGNSITAADIADMWIHEAFTTWAEAVYIECQWGKKEAVKYLKGTQKTRVKNDTPIIGHYGVNKEGSPDMYSKGANMIHTLRSIVNDDEKWWKIIRKFNADFKYKITNTDEVVAFFAKEIEGLNVSEFFDQYLKHTTLPVLEIQSDKNRIGFRWKTNIPKFNMPIDIVVNSQKLRIQPSSKWENLSFSKPIQTFEPDTDNFYIEVKRL